MFVVMAVVFVLGYVMIALEHPLKIDKAATALLTGTLLWALYMLGAESVLPNSPYFAEFLHEHPDGNYVDFIAHQEVYHHLAEISTIIFFYSPPGSLPSPCRDLNNNFLFAGSHDNS